MGMATLVNKNIYQGPGYSFRALVHYRQGGKHGSVQASMVLEKELRVLQLDLQATRRVTLGLAWAFETLKPTSSDILPTTRSHLLQ